METAPETPAVVEPQNEASALDGAIQESKEAISGAAPTKRSPGRHKKDCQCENCVAKRAAAPEAAKPPKSEKAVAAPALPAEYLEPIIAFPFDAMAKKTRWKDWELTAEEKKKNAELLEKCMARYFPQLESSHAELVGLSLGLGFAFYGRFLAYQEYRKTLPAIQSPAAQQADTDNNPAGQRSPLKVVDTGVKPSPALSSLLDESQNPL